MQEAAASDQSDDDRYDSDVSSQRRPRKRMSIITNRYLDTRKSAPPRRFFKSSATWNDIHYRVESAGEPVLQNGARQGGLPVLMESGGRGTPTGDINMDEDWEDGASV